MSDAEVHRQLGALQATVEHLTDSVHTLTTTWAAQEASAAAARKVLHEKFEALQQSVGAQMTSLGLRVDRVVDTMAKVEPAVKKYEDEKLRQEGAKKLGAQLWGATMAIAGVIGWGLHELVGYLRH